MKISQVSIANAQINLGATTCYLIKNIYYSDKDWIDCYKYVSSKFARLKEIMGKKAPNIEEIELLKIIGTMTVEDIKDVFDEDK
jgi:predicted DNA-binding protein (UPF0278 family)